MMKKDWITQEQVNETAEKLMVEKSLRPDEITGHSVARALGKKSANYSILEKTREWRDMKRAELEGPAVDVPSEALEAVTKVIDDHGAALITKVNKVLNDGYNVIQAAADLKNVAITKIASDARVAAEEIMEVLAHTEAELEQVRAERDKWEAKSRAAEKEVSDLRANVATLRDLIAQHLQAPMPADRGTSPATVRPSDEISAPRAAPATDAEGGLPTVTAAEANDKASSTARRGPATPPGNESAERRQDALPLTDLAAAPSRPDVDPSSATGAAKPAPAPRPLDKPQGLASGSDSTDTRGGGA